MITGRGISERLGYRLGMGTAHRILVVEDDRVIADAVTRRLTSEGFDVDTVHDGLAAVAAATSTAYDAAVLDVMLPGLDGLEVCRRIQSARPLPVLMLTARAEETDRIVGLGVGADDYLTKPFSPRELVARVRAVLRRSEIAASAPGDIVRAGDVEVDVSRVQATVEGRRVDLTATEVQLLAHLAREPGRVFTRGQLLDVLHGVAFESFERAIDSHIRNIRKKIEPDPGRPRYIQSVYGVGYRFAEPGAPSK
jgi:two-component system response regulator RegX3